MIKKSNENLNKKREAQLKKLKELRTNKKSGDQFLRI